MRKNKKKTQSQELVLQITSLADIFIIILVFLIKTFSSTTSAISMQSDLVLPVSVSSETMISSIKVELSQKELILENQMVVGLDNFLLPKDDLEADGTSRSLNVAFSNFLKKSNDNVNIPAAMKLLVMADEKTPYISLSSVFASAARIGILDYKLIVVEDR